MASLWCRDGTGAECAGALGEALLLRSAMMMRRRRNLSSGWAICATVMGLAWLSLCQAADPPAKLLACRAIEDAKARLACFDREAAALAPALSPARCSNRKTICACPAERSVAASEVSAGTRIPDPAKN